MLDFRMIVTFEETFTLIFETINNSPLLYQSAKQKNGWVVHDGIIFGPTYVKEVQTLQIFNTGPHSNYSNTQFWPLNVGQKSVLPSSHCVLEQYLKRRVDSF